MLNLFRWIVFWKYEGIRPVNFISS